jgi:hypothetical protein
MPEYVSVIFSLICAVGVVQEKFESDYECWACNVRDKDLHYDGESLIYTNYML